MSTPQKRKGTAFESAVRDYLNDAWHIPAYRPAQTGYRDVGDLHGVSPFILQCKNYANLADALRDGVDGALVQRSNAGEKYGAAVIKRPRKPVADAYVVMPLSEFGQLLSHIRATPVWGADSRA
jgi:hypothetical protein